MHARVVRFTDVSADRVAEIAATAESQGPPPGVDSSGLELLYDESEGTAVFVAYFDNKEKMAAASEVLENMDASETPGTRASVDVCEVKVQRRL